MQVTSFVSFKGGSGKTTTAIATASALVDSGAGSVFVLDLDERQKSLIRWLEDTRKVYGALAPDPSLLDGAAVTTGQTNEEAIAEILGILKQASQTYDYCIIDTQGTQTPLAVAAIQISDLVLIPFQLTGVEIEPFITTFKLAEKHLKVPGAHVSGLITRMPNIASTTMNSTREVLAKYQIAVENGTSQRDGYQQLVFETGTFKMMDAKFSLEAKNAEDTKARKRAENESGKARAAGSNATMMLERLGLIQTKPQRSERRGAA
jgi:chromosome partitioning protein